MARYPGYFTANNGFLDDSIFIQDSKYYQAFSYVIKIDQRLSDYKSIVKSLLHPAGMALFSEFNITNNFDLSISLQSLVKALGVGLADEFLMMDSGATLLTSKVLFDNLNTPLDSSYTFAISKALEDTSVGTISDAVVLLTGKVFTDSISTPTDNTTTFAIGKALSDNYSGAIDTTYTFDISKALLESDIGTLLDVASISSSKTLADSFSTPSDVATLLTSKALTESDVGTWSDSAVLTTGKTLSDSQAMADSISAFDITTLYADSQPIVDLTTLLTAKYVTDSSVGTFDSAGEVWLNSYQAQDYYVQAATGQQYSVGLSATFT